MSQRLFKVIIAFSLLVILITGCAHNKRSLMEYDYPPYPQEYYTPFNFPYYYPSPYIPYQNQPYIFYPPYYYFQPYPFMYP
ncbi:MAG: hypothetical protein HZA08_07755 [Nitrospirae bacterium]|nr:hypothetical protein [Nitrospirota bacterium]